ncbi:hypothetical protein ACPPVO_49520 [Dactylosporangium sp. McL0621]|uniref:hypothetical protein n=1 Tax=Dactylosporangium sp. McL0621 TaxID=3415678 RepID=UPI003CEA9486
MRACFVLALAGRAGLGHPATSRHVRPPAPVAWSSWAPPAAAGPPQPAAPGNDWVAPWSRSTR